MGSDRLVGGIAVLAGGVAMTSVTSLAAFFAVGGPFGAINDWTVGILGLLTGLLAFGLSRRDRRTRWVPEDVSTVIAIAGSAVVVVGSALVISDTTGFLLAGLVESLGFALIGVWLIVLSRSLRAAKLWPRRLSGLGILAGVVMATGFAAAPGIAMRLDDMESAPGWVWFGFLDWLGIFFLFPLWTMWFGLGARRKPG